MTNIDYIKADIYPADVIQTMYMEMQFNLTKRQQRMRDHVLGPMQDWPFVTVISMRHELQRNDAYMARMQYSVFAREEIEA